MKIAFTGHGAIAKAFAKKFPASIYSFRNLSELAQVDIIKQSDCLVHNAASLNNESYSKNVDSNFSLTKHLLDICEEYNPSIKFIYLSSMSILNPIMEYKRIEDMGPYAFSKYLGEIYCLKSKISNCTAIRFSTIFYQDHERDGLSKMIKKAVDNKRIDIYNGGAETRDIIPIDVAVEYLNKVIKQAVSDRVINICSGIEVSYKEIALRIKEILKHAEIVDQKVAGEEQFFLSKFDTADIVKLGVVNYSLVGEMQRYINSLEQR